MHLLNSVIAEPRGLACLTYSREAAREFTERLNELGLVRGNNIFLGTVHSFCLTEILGKFSDVYSLNIPTPIRIASEKQRTQLFETAKKNVECDNKYFKIERMNCTRMLSVSGVSNISVDRDKIMIDPGIGFAKTLEENLLVMNQLDRLKELGFPILLGTSRKSMIGLTLNLPADERLEGTIATTVIGVMKGCSFIRVHDVQQNRRAALMARAIISSR